MASRCALAALQSQSQDLPLGSGECALAGSIKTPQVVTTLLSSLGVHQMSLLAHLKEGSPVLLGIICALYLSV